MSDPTVENTFQEKAWNQWFSPGIINIRAAWQGSLGHRKISYRERFGRSLIGFFQCIPILNFIAQTADKHFYNSNINKNVRVLAPITSLKRRQQAASKLKQEQMNPHEIQMEYLQTLLRTFLIEKTPSLVDWLLNVLRDLKSDDAFMHHLDILMHEAAEREIPIQPLSFLHYVSAAPEVTEAHFIQFIKLFDNVYHTLWKHEESRNHIIDSVIEILVPFCSDHTLYTSSIPESVVMGALDGLNNFFHDLESVLKQRSYLWVNYATLHQGTRAQEIHNSMLEKLFADCQKIPSLEDQLNELANSFQLYHNRAQLSHGIKSKFESDCGMPSSSISFVMAHLTARAIDSLTQPKFIAGFIHNAVLLDLKEISQSKLPNSLGSYNGNPEFSEGLNKKLKILTGRICKLGTETGAGHLLSQLAHKLLPLFFPATIGDKIQRKFIHILQSDINNPTIQLIQLLLRISPTLEEDPHQLKHATLKLVLQRLKKHLRTLRATPGQVNFALNSTEVIIKNLLSILYNKNFANLLIRYALRDIIIALQSH